MLYLLYTFATSEPNRRTCGGRRISWRCLGHQSESCRFLTTLPVGFCIQRGKPAGKLADDAGRWYRPYATTLPSSPHGAQTLPDQERRERDQRSSEPREQAIAIQPDECPNE